MDTQTPGFDPFAKAKGTVYENYPDRLAEVYNQNAYDHLTQQIDMENADRKTLSEAGFGGTVASVAAGVLDWPTLIPAGRMVQSAAIGYDVAKSALAGGIAGAVGAGAQSAALQATQVTRTPEENAIAVGGGALLGGLLGAAGSKLLDNVAWNKAAAELERDVYSTEPLASDVAEADMKSLLDEAATSAPTTQAAPASAGAAAVDAPSKDALTVYGRVARAATNATAQMNPLLRALTSPSAETRNILLNLVENPIYLKANYAGQASARAVETIVKAYDGAYVKAMESTKSAWVTARKGGEKMGYDEFRSRVGQAMRTGDIDAAGNSFVTEQAQNWRKTVFDPLKQKAIDAGMLPEDVSVETADSYFTRMYDVRKIEGQEPQFKQIVREWMMDNIAQQEKAATDAHAERSAYWSSQIADLELRKEDSQALLNSLPAQLKAMKEANPAFAETDASLSDIRARLSSARKASAPMQTIKGLEQELKTATANAGPDYAKYASDRAAINARVSRIRNNIVGRQGIVDELHARIAAMEGENLDRLGRLHKALTGLDERIDLTPKQIAAELEKARNDFAQILERSNKAQDRLAKAKAAREAKAASLAEKGDTVAANDLAHQGDLGDPFVSEAKNISRLADLAEEIERLEKIDPEAALAELRNAVSNRMEQTAGLVEASTRRMADLVARAERYNPDVARAAVERLKGKIAASEAKVSELTDMLPAERQVYVEEAVNSIYNKITGRAIDTQGDSPFRVVANSRGPMKERTFTIPDAKIASFLIDDIEHVAHRYTRTMGADIELSNVSRRLGGDGKPDLKSMIERIRKDYDQQRLAAPDEKARVKLNDREKADIRDLEAVRDMLRGQYMAGANSSGWAKVLNAAMAFNYMRTMGGVVLSSLTDIGRPIMVHGMQRWIGDGVVPLVTNLKAFKMAAGEAKSAGVVGEQVRNATLATYGELTNPYGIGSPFERLVNNTARMFSKATLMPMWDDYQKAFSSVITQNRILKNAEKWGSLAAKEKAYMNFLGIDQSMSERILAQFQEHGQVLKTIRAANTEAWTDDLAREAYRSAIAKDVGSIIVTKGLADVPLFMHTPAGRALSQFRGFAMAAHQRAFLRGLQEDQAAMVSGLIVSTTIGAFIYYLKTIEAGRSDDLSDNPGRFIAEGVDRSGLFPYLFEVNNTAEKIGIPGIYAGLQKLWPDRMQKQPASRFASRSAVDSYLGPTVGAAKDVMDVAGAAFRGDMSPSDIAAMRRLTPGASLPQIRWAIDGTIVPEMKEAVK
ncbi:hypothetical protein [Pleomorphomonas oryzae]|uniref:hypothetical protein n=1 Tax=Pleomorphomonas oryzae TaxID=261934 RepID=UPI0012EBAB3A|nr:hypothetical protein [Pleomorphomonas oryzae]